jgi:thiamine biosynthesis protein ThiS
MQIKVNGESREFQAPLSVMALAAELKLNPKQVAVERNRAIVPRSQYGEQMLSEGDQIEIVHFIGGG